MNWPKATGTLRIEKERRLDTYARCSSFQGDYSPGRPRDEKRWRDLFDGYCLFYKRAPSEPLTHHTWERIMDDASTIHGIVAENQKTASSVSPTT